MVADRLWAKKITKFTVGAKNFVNDSQIIGLQQIQRFFSADNKFVSDEYQQISPIVRHFKFASG